MSHCIACPPTDDGSTHESEVGRLCCARAAARMAGALRSIPDLCDQLETRTEEDENGNNPIDQLLPAGPLKSAWRQSRVSGTRPERLVIAVDSTDLLMPSRPGSLAVADTGRWPQDQVGHLAVATELEFWVRDWASYRDEGLPNPSVRSLASWLLDRLDDACSWHYALDEFADKLRAIHGALFGLCGYGDARPKAMDAPCPVCGDLALFQPFPESHIECAGEDCGRILTFDEYEEMVAEMRHEIRAQDVLTALNGCASVDLEKVRFAVITEADEALGEVLVLLKGRLFPGLARLHESVVVTEFKTLEEALARRAEVLAAAQDAA